MTNEQINNLEKRPYTFGNKKGIEVSYDEEINAVVLPEHLFRYILSLIPSEREGIERQTGEWVNDENHIPICSKCGYIPPYDRAIDDYEYSNFCPSCGARMNIV